MDKYKIRVAVDTEEGRQFVDWLNGQGHEAVLGTDTGDHVNGVWTSTDISAQAIMTALWIKYCN